MRVLVTGAGGLLGGAVVRHLAPRADLEVIAADRQRLDLTDRGLAARLAELAPDVVVNAAGRTSGDAAAFLADNAIAAASLAAAMREAVPRSGLVQLGSAAQYGAGAPDRLLSEDDPCLPQSPYGISKQAAETCLFAEARNGLAVAALRVFNVVAADAAGGQALAAFLRRAARAMSAGPPWLVTVGPLGAVRDFVALQDVARAVEAVIDRGAWGAAINVCTGVGRPVRDLLQAVAGELGVEIREDETPETGVSWSVGDPTRCERRLGLRPSADLAPLVRAAADWVRQEAKTDARSRA